MSLAGDILASLHDYKIVHPLMATALLKGQDGTTQGEEAIPSLVTRLCPKGSGLSPFLAQQGPTLVSY